MEKKLIKVNDFISLNKGVTPDEGKKIYDQIVSHFEEGEGVILDFENVELMTTAYLNVAIGNLYEKYDSTRLKELLDFRHLNTILVNRIKKVTDNAKLFYSNSDKYITVVGDVINENK